MAAEQTSNEINKYKDIFDIITIFIMDSEAHICDYTFVREWDLSTHLVPTQMPPDGSLGGEKVDR